MSPKLKATISFEYNVLEAVDPKAAANEDTSNLYANAAYIVEKAIPGLPYFDVSNYEATVEVINDSNTGNRVVPDGFTESIFPGSTDWPNS